MTTADRGESVFPLRLPAPPGAQGELERVGGLFALHGAGDAAGGEPLFSLAGGRIAVVRGDMKSASGEVSPVYATPGGPLSVPTGRLFVRFRAGVSAEQKRAELASAGYRIERVPGYAPHTAWVRSTEDTIASTLNGVPRLRALAELEHVEPEMLTRRDERRE